jgi:pyruvate ferredoxin oxidoreductase gamma subunit
MYRIRLHGRGGQGMKTASRILGTAFFLEGFEVQDAQRYGAERRGAPIFAYVRAGREPINERGVITRPDLVVVADDTLVPVPAAGVMQGVTEGTVLLIDSTVSSEEWKQRLNAPGQVIILPASQRREATEAAYLGAECAGAAAGLIDVVPRESLEAAIRHELALMRADVIEENVAIALAAFDRMAPHAGIVKERDGASASGYQAPGWVDVPTDEVSVSGPAIYAGATSVEVRTGLWRTMRPVIDHSRCNRCTWVCGSFCPDGAIHVDANGYPQVDLDHCKGCMICVAQCPPHAIEAVPETEAAARDKEKEGASA